MKILFALLAAVVAAGVSLAENADTVDPRVRTWVWPKRIVWTSDTASDGTESGVKEVDLLLAPRTGQVPEGKWLSGTGCTLVNDGQPAGFLLDFGRELHGGIQIGCGVRGPKEKKVRVRFGESVAEAMSELGERGAQNDHAIRDDIVELPFLGTREIGNTGFRFVRIDLVTKGSVGIDFVRAVSLMRPMERLGSFTSSDERLNRIWETAVRTVHLCCQEYLWDGIKRDRLVWMGDTHPETRSLLAVFGAADILPESLGYMAILTPPAEAMNSMAPYSMWYIRNVRDWWYYTGDRTFIEKHRDYLKAVLDYIAAGITPENTFDDEKRGGFLDWPTVHNRKAMLSGMQALLLTTLRDGAELMRALDETDMARFCDETAARVATVRPDPAGSKQAAALLALSGLHTPREMFDTVLGKNGVDGVSTFYGYYMLEAMSAAGENQHALDTVRDYWGAMLDVGATSFWEDFKVSWTNNCFRIDELPVPGKKDIHGDYGEFCYTGFRHSLCHGWSSGPAAWCINHILGITPAAPGCAAVKVEPFLGDLEWAEGSFPTPHGVVRVRCEKKPDGKLETKISAPPGVKILSRD